MLTDGCTTCSVSAGVLLYIWMHRPTHSRNYQSFLHLHDSALLITILLYCILSQTCSLSTHWWINMVLFKESLTCHQFWPYSLECLERTSCDLFASLQGLKSAESTIRGRVPCKSRRSSEGGNVKWDSDGEDDGRAYEGKCLFEMFLATLYDEWGGW